MQIIWLVLVLYSIFIPCYGYIYLAEENNQIGVFIGEQENIEKQKIAVIPLYSMFSDILYVEPYVKISYSPNQKDNIFIFNQSTIIQVSSISIQVVGTSVLLNNSPIFNNILKELHQSNSEAYNNVDIPQNCEAYSTSNTTQSIWICRGNNPTIYKREEICVMDSSTEVILENQDVNCATLFQITAPKITIKTCNIVAGENLILESNIITIVDSTLTSTGQMEIHKQMAESIYSITISITDSTLTYSTLTSYTEFLLIENTSLTSTIMSLVPGYYTEFSAITCTVSSARNEYKNIKFEISGEGTFQQSTFTDLVNVTGQQIVFEEVSFSNSIVYIDVDAHSTTDFGLQMINCIVSHSTFDANCDTPYQGISITGSDTMFTDHSTIDFTTVVTGGVSAVTGIYLDEIMMVSTGSIVEISSTISSSNTAGSSIGVLMDTDFDLTVEQSSQFNINSNVHLSETMAKGVVIQDCILSGDNGSSQNIIISSEILSDAKGNAIECSSNSNLNNVKMEGIQNNDGRAVLFRQSDDGDNFVVTINQSKIKGIVYASASTSPIIQIIDLSNVNMEIINSELDLIIYETGFGTVTFQDFIGLEVTEFQTLEDVTIVADLRGHFINSYGVQFIDGVISKKNLHIESTMAYCISDCEAISIIGFVPSSGNSKTINMNGKIEDYADGVRSCIGISLKNSIINTENFQITASADIAFESNNNIFTTDIISITGTSTNSDTGNSGDFGTIIESSTFTLNEQTQIQGSSEGRGGLLISGSIFYTDIYVTLIGESKNGIGISWNGNTLSPEARVNVTGFSNLGTHGVLFSAPSTSKKTIGTVTLSSPIIHGTANNGHGIEFPQNMILQHCIDIHGISYSSDYDKFGVLFGGQVTISQHCFAGTPMIRGESTLGGGIKFPDSTNINSINSLEISGYGCQALNFNQELSLITSDNVSIRSEITNSNACNPIDIIYGTLINAGVIIINSNNPYLGATSDTANRATLLQINEKIRTDNSDDIIINSTLTGGVQCIGVRLFEVGMSSSSSVVTINSNSNVAPLVAVHSENCPSLTNLNINATVNINSVYTSFGNVLFRSSTLSNSIITSNMNVISNFGNGYGILYDTTTIEHTEINVNIDIASNSNSNSVSGIEFQRGNRLTDVQINVNIDSDKNIFGVKHNSNIDVEFDTCNINVEISSAITDCYGIYFNEGVSIRSSSFISTIYSKDTQMCTNLVAMFYGSTLSSFSTNYLEGNIVNYCNTCTGILQSNNIYFYGDSNIELIGITPKNESCYGVRLESTNIAAPSLTSPLSLSLDIYGVGNIGVLMINVMGTVDILSIIGEGDGSSSTFAPGFNGKGIFWASDPTTPLFVKNSISLYGTSLSEEGIYVNSFNLDTSEVQIMFFSGESANNFADIRFVDTFEVMVDDCEITFDGKIDIANNLIILGTISHTSIQVQIKEGGRVGRDTNLDFRGDTFIWNGLLSSTFTSETNDLHLCGTFESALFNAENSIIEIDCLEQQITEFFSSGDMKFSKINAGTNFEAVVYFEAILIYFTNDIGVDKPLHFISIKNTQTVKIDANIQIKTLNGQEYNQVDLIEPKITGDPCDISLTDNNASIDFYFTNIRCDVNVLGNSNWDENTILYSNAQLLTGTHMINGTHSQKTTLSNSCVLTGTGSFGLVTVDTVDTVINPYPVSNGANIKMTFQNLNFQFVASMLLQIIDINTYSQIKIDNVISCDGILLDFDQLITLPQETILVFMEGRLANLFSKLNLSYNSDPITDHSVITHDSNNYVFYSPTAIFSRNFVTIYQNYPPIANNDLCDSACPVDASPCACVCSIDVIANDYDLDPDNNYPLTVTNADLGPTCSITSSIITCISTDTPEQSFTYSAMDSNGGVSDPAMITFRCSTETPSATPSISFSATSSATPPPTLSATNTPSRTPSPTNTKSATNTPTKTSSKTPSNTPSHTSSNTASLTPSKSPTQTPSPTGTSSSTKTGTSTPTSTMTPSGTSSSTPSSSISNSKSPTISKTGTLSPSNTGSNTPTLINTATIPAATLNSTPFTGSGTRTSTGTGSSAPTKSNTSVVQSPTNTPTISKTPTSTNSQSSTSSSTLSPTKTSTPTKTPTKTSTSTPTPTSTPTSTASSSSSPSGTITSTKSNLIVSPLPSKSTTSSISLTQTTTVTSTSTLSPTVTTTPTPEPSDSSSITNIPSLSNTNSGTPSPSNSDSSTATSSTTISMGSIAGPAPITIFNSTTLTPNLPSIVRSRFIESATITPSIANTQSCFIGCNQSSAIIVPEFTPAGGTILVSTPDEFIVSASDTSLIFSPIFSVTTTENQNTLGGNVQICIAPQEETNEDLCLGFLDESEIPPKWKCEDPCLDENETGMLCGETDHFTNFALLLSGNAGGNSRCGSSSMDWITGSITGDAILISITVGVVIGIGLLFLILANVPPLDRVVRGQEGYRLQKIRKLAIQDKALVDPHTTEFNPN